MVKAFGDALKLLSPNHETDPREGVKNDENIS